MSGEVWTLFINGPYGVGKSTTLDHVGDLLAEAHRAFPLMDVDWFHRSWPSGADDPDNVLTEARNMAAVWANYQAAGPRQLVVAGVIASPADRRRYEDATGMRVRSVRLAATPATAEARLRRRYTPERQAMLSWHLMRQRNLSRQLSEAADDEAVVATDDLSPRMVARRVLQHVGLL